jgi:hypothetical protein
VKYDANYDIKIFWLRKVQRLGIKLAVIDLFLLLLFLIGHRSGIWTWQTIVNVFGLNGFLNWFQIRNPSPFGRGMWFFTLLLIFYLLYPILEYLTRNKPISFFLTALFVLIAFYLHNHVEIGHALWLTACGFVLGIVFARNMIKIPLYLSIVALICCLFIMSYLNYFLGIKTYNYFLILSLGILSASVLINIRLPFAFFTASSFFSGCIFEIYLIHPYIRYQGTKYMFVDVMISLLVVIIAAKLLQLISSEIEKRLLSQSNRSNKLETGIS